MARKHLQGLRVAVLAADGFEQVELMEPARELEKQGAEAEVVSLRPGSVQGMNLLETGRKVNVDATLSMVTAEDYHALFIPGGFISPDFLRQSETALEFVYEFERAGKPIAVISQGAWLLISAGLISGRRLASWPGIQDDIRNAGGTWENRPVVHDGNWVSSRGAQDLAQFQDAMISLFAERVPLGAHDHDAESGSTLKQWVAGGLALAAVGYGIRRRR